MPRLRRPQASLPTLLRGLFTRPFSFSISLRVPGKSHTGPLPPLSADQAALADRLRADIQWLAGDIGKRNLFHPTAYRAAEDGLALRLSNLGLHVRRQPFLVHGDQCANLFADVQGSGPSAHEILVYGAHYDSIRNCPAANDNGTGVAAVLELSRRLAQLPVSERPRRTIRLALFANEEPPHFWTDHMGSLVMARAFKAARDNIVGMITPETIGYFSDEPRSQSYPLPLGGDGWGYPTTGNFVAFIGLPGSRRLLKNTIGAFRDAAAFPSIGAVLPASVPGVGSSDHWSFFKCGYPALMVTDTAPFRYPYYHTPEDTPDKVDYPKLARVVDGLSTAALRVANTL